MTSRDIDLIVRGTAPALKGFVRHELQALKQQIDTLTLKEGPAGKDGRDGRDGKDGAAGEKGLDGLDGKDGLGFDDLEMLFDGERTITLKWSQGERVKTSSVTFATMLYRGVYDAAKAYETGDAVTWGGNIWVAKANTGEQPGFTNASSSWQLACKAGRDGKPGKVA